MANKFRRKMHVLRTSVFVHIMCFLADVPFSSSCRDPADKVQLLGLVLRSDGEGVQQAQ